jgi:predicted choloylglycine hydrolase
MALFGKHAHPVVVVSGTWEEMGYQIGSRKECAKNIRRTASFVRRDFTTAEATLYFDKVKSFIPESVLTQMKGLARGLSDVLNISYEEAWKDVLVWNFYVASTYMKSCTAFAVSSPGGNFIAHNTDLEYLYSLGGVVTIFKPDPGLGYPFVSFFSPGFVGVGLSENLTGLAVVYNAAFPSGRQYGLPPLLMVRKVMEKCSSLDEAIQTFQSFLDGGGRFAHNGTNLTLMDFKTGELALLELAPDRIEVDRGIIEGQKRYVLTTNHYHLMPERNQREDFNTSSYARFERAKMLLTITEDFSLAQILKILSDHDGQEQGTNHTICRHKDLNVGTNSFHVFDDQFTLYYILGNPCRYWGDPTILQTVRWRKVLEQG